MLRQTELVSFDGTERVSSTVARPERYGALFEAISGSGPFIARGAGLSYAAASMGAGAVSIDMNRFNRILAFDEITGDVVVEPGITVGALLEFLAKRGFGLPVVPGYPAISVGGCIAFDVHGKSQFHSGNFGEWVQELDLVHPRHGTITCSRTQNEEAFELTTGGFGLTGLIYRVRLRTERLRGNAIELSTEPVSSLEHAAEVMEAMSSDVAALYSWHNLTGSRRKFGSGFVFLERFVTAESPLPKRAGLVDISQRLPLPMWNRITSPIALGLYEVMKRAERPRVIGLRRGFFPIAGLEGYYAAFGKTGFREYQLIVPRQQFAAFVTALAKLIERESVPVTLASLKLFRGSASLLRFRGAGICLALDVPAGRAASAFFEGLDNLAETHGACINLAKDSRIDAAVCRRLFPEYEHFKQRMATYDPGRRCSSQLRGRIDA